MSDFLLGTLGKSYSTICTDCSTFAAVGCESVAIKQALAFGSNGVRRLFGLDQKSKSERSIAEQHKARLWDFFHVIQIPKAQVR